MAYSSESENVGFEFCSSSEGADSIEERMLTAEELFYDGKLRPLSQTYEWWAPSNQKAGDACAPNAGCRFYSPSSATLWKSPSMADAAAEDVPEAGGFGHLRVVKESTDLACADHEMAFNSSEWICFSPSPTFCIQAEIDRNSEDTENMGVSGHSVGDGYLHPRSSNAEERACLSPLSTNRSLHAPSVSGQGAKTNNQSLPNAGIKQATAKNPTSNQSVERAIVVASACRLTNVSKGVRLVESNPVASTAQVSCLLTSTCTSTSSSSSSSSSSACPPLTCGSFSSTPLLSSSSSYSSSSSALVSSLLLALSSAQSSTFFTSPSSPPFSPFTSTPLHATPSSPPFSPFTTSSMPSSSSFSSSLFPALEKKHPLLSSPSSRSTHCSCSCRIPLRSLWPFSRYKESIYPCLQSSEYVSLKSQEIVRKKDGCIASNGQYSPTECKQMRHHQQTKAVKTTTSSTQAHPALKYVNDATVVSNEQRWGGDCRQMINSASDKHATVAKKMATRGESKVMQMGFREYTRKKGVSTPTVRVTPILSIVPGCMGPSLSKNRPKSTKAFM